MMAAVRARACALPPLTVVSPFFLLPGAGVDKLRAALGVLLQRSRSLRWLSADLVFLCAPDLRRLWGVKEEEWESAAAAAVAAAAVAAPAAAEKDEKKKAQ